MNTNSLFSLGFKIVFIAVMAVSLPVNAEENLGVKDSHEMFAATLEQFNKNGFDSASMPDRTAVNWLREFVRNVKAKRTGSAVNLQAGIKNFRQLAEAAQNVADSIDTLGASSDVSFAGSGTYYMQLAEAAQNVADSINTFGASSDVNFAGSGTYYMQLAEAAQNIADLAHTFDVSSDVNFAGSGTYYMQLAEAAQNIADSANTFDVSSAVNLARSGVGDSYINVAAIDIAQF